MYLPWRLTTCFQSRFQDHLGLISTFKKDLSSSLMWVSFMSWWYWPRNEGFPANINKWLVITYSFKPLCSLKLKWVPALDVNVQLAPRRDGGGQKEVKPSKDGTWAEQDQRGWCISEIKKSFKSADFNRQLINGAGNAVINSKNLATDCKPSDWPLQNKIEQAGVELG